MRKAAALKVLGEHVAKLRRDRGFTQEQLAERMGVSRNHVADIELGTRNTGVFSLLMLARALDVSGGEILFVFTPGGAAEAEAGDVRVRFLGVTRASPVDDS